MIFGIIIILLIGVIAFFHFLQGFFSATLSAIFAVIAAVFAFSYHETIIESFLGGKMADSIHAIVLLVLFALIYLVLRTIFDNLVPGNVRLPVALDKGGAAVMGVIAGVFATGILAIAAQELPFGPSVAGYARYDVTDRKTLVQQLNGRDLDSKLFDVMTAEKPADWGDQHSLIVPVDDIVLGTVRKLSSPDGSLDDGKPLAAVHPDYLQELFGQRAGIETGGERVAVNLPKQRLQSVKLVGLYTVDSKIPEKDPEYAKVRTGGALKPDVRPTNGQQFLVVRVMFDRQAADPDGVVRFGTGACRLVLPKRGEEGEFVDVYPVGTLSSDTKTLFLNKLDDYLFVSVKDGDKGADLVFVVDKNVFDKGAPDGTFLGFKRMARLDLAGKTLSKKPIAPDPGIDVMRKPLVLDPNWSPNQQFNLPPPPPPPPQQSASTEQQGAKPSFKYVNAAVSSDLPVQITVPAGATGFTQVPGGNAAIKEGKADALDVTSAAAAQTQGTPVTQADVPSGKVMVKVNGSPAAGAASPWQCVTECDQIQLVDSTGAKYPPYGVYATYTGGSANKFMLQYNAKNALAGPAQPADASGGPRDVTLMYLVPQGVTLNELDDHQQKTQISVTANK